MVSLPPQLAEVLATTLGLMDRSLNLLLPDRHILLNLRVSHNGLPVVLESGLGVWISLFTLRFKVLPHLLVREVVA